MKKTLIILAALQYSATLQAAVGDILDLSQGYIADGVNATINNGVLAGFDKYAVQESTRFYDSSKGWASANGRYGDSNMCWAHTASNMIQYWQSYYGVFYKGATPLPYGTDYTRTYKSAFAAYNDITVPDPMRLNVAKDIINVGFNSSNTGKRVTEGTNYFFSWVDSGGGYYSEYFGPIRSGQVSADDHTGIITEVSSLNDLKSTLFNALGIQEVNGSYVQVESGLIAHINVGKENAAHTLTCYGFTLDENQNINSLLIADSDDQWLYTYGPDNTGENGAFTPKLEQAFIKVDNGNMYLYEDAAFTTPTVDSTYSIGAVTYINTPEVLKQMLAEYSDTTNEAQVWNGSSDVWSIQQATTEELPTEATGWDVHVNGESITAQGHDGYYHTYSVDGRDVLFGDHAQNRNVSVVGTVSAGHIDIAASGYSFTKGSDDATIKAGADMTIRSGASLSSELKLQLNNLTLETGSTLKAIEPIVVTGDFVAGAAEATTFTSRATVLPEVNVLSALDLREADSITLQTTVNMNGNDLYLSEGAKFYITQQNEGNEIAAFSNIGKLYLGDSMTESYIINAEIYYAGSETPIEYLLVYNQQLNSLSFVNTIPEPTTATLSLLALTALACRRRRR